MSILKEKERDCARRVFSLVDSDYKDIRTIKVRVEGKNLIVKVKFRWYCRLVPFYRKLRMSMFTRSIQAAISEFVFYGVIEE